MTRRLAAIVYADVAGYSRLMDEDEEVTLAALKAHRAAMDPLIFNHDGRVVKNTGDGVLLEFPQQLRRDLGKLLEEIPKERRSDQGIQRLSEAARVQLVMLVRLKYQAKKYETANKMFDFSRRSMEERWAAGYDDAQVAISEPGVRELPDPSVQPGSAMCTMAG
jgi:class 3 adenylate cyclase